MSEQLKDFPKVDTRELEQAMLAIAQDRRLTSAAYGLAMETRIYNHAQNPQASYAEYREDFLRLESSEFLQQQLFTALRYMERLIPTKSANQQSPHSYALKHWAERWGHKQGYCGYVSNGVIILAATMLNFPLSGKGNPFIGVSRKSLRSLKQDARRMSDRP
ncbi:MAG: hypothetical protein SNJ57_16270 [Cyanobacteriota bacterium]